MRASTISDFGAQPRLAELPEPRAEAGEVLVRVKTASLNGFDAMMAAGMLKAMMEHHFPVVLGKDFAGTVEATGEGVSRFVVGDEVFGVVMKPELGDGSFGEYVTVSEQYGIALLPVEIDLPAAGALGLAGSAALDLVDALRPRTGEIILISGATGGVGAMVIQYAVAAGARVIATARPGDETTFVRQLGAEQVVDYTDDLATQVRAIAPDGVAGVVHLAGDGAALADLLAPAGRLVSTLGLGPDQHPAAVAVMASPQQATLERLAADVAGGRVRVPISHTYGLEEVPAALADFSAGTLGKLAVTMS